MPSSEQPHRPRLHAHTNCERTGSPAKVARHGRPKRSMEAQQASSGGSTLAQPDSALLKPAAQRCAEPATLSTPHWTSKASLQRVEEAWKVGEVQVGTGRRWQRKGA